VRIGIIGTGAVGGYFGAKFKLAGNDVVFLSRGENLKAMKKSGLQLKTAGKIYKIKDAIFTDNPADIGELDYILFTVKSYDTRSTARQIKNIIKSNTVIITPQNGINNDLILGEILGKEKIIPGMAKVGVSVPKPGRIEHTSLGIIIIGEYDGSISERLKKFQRIAQNAGIECVISEQILKDRWKKYIWNCTFNIIAAITGLRLDQILSNKHLKQLCIDTIKEITRIAVKEKVRITEVEALKASLELADNLGKFKPSTLEDIEKGKPIELDAFTGTVISLGNKHKMDTPINKVFYALLHGKVN